MHTERRLLAIAVILAVLASVTVGLLTGRDLPLNVTGVLLAALGATLGAGALERRKADRPPTPPARPRRPPIDLPGIGTAPDPLDDPPDERNPS